MTLRSGFGPRRTRATIRRSAPRRTSTSRLAWTTYEDGAHQPSIRQVGRAKLSRELWLLVHPELRHQARIAAVIEWLERLVRRRPQGS